MNRVVLGTAQFGLDYGINNKRGKIPQKEAFEILNKAIQHGIDTIDTASFYGKSERVLGKFMKAYQRELKIISKLPECESNEVKKIIDSSLNNLGIRSLYGYLIHNFDNYKKDQKIWDELEKLSKTGKIKKIGFSLYSPFELEFILKSNLKIDIAQIPFSIFDQRFKIYFPELKKRKIEIYIRSVFLQGLVFKKPVELNGFFERIKDNIKKLNLLSKESGIPIFALCLNFVIRQEFIDKIIVGVDNIQNFNEILQASNFILKTEKLISELSNLRIDDEKILLPITWNVNKATV